MYIFQSNHLYIIYSIIVIHYYDTDMCDAYCSFHVFTFGLRYIIVHVK